MKFKSLILLVISLFILFSCDDGIKFDNPNDRNSDAYNPSDTEGETDSDSDETDTISENDDETDNPSETDNDEPISDDSDSDSTSDDADSIDDSDSESTSDDADFIDDSDDPEPDENNSDDDSADSVPDDDSDLTDPTPDESDSTPDEDTDTDSGDSTPDQDTDIDTTPADTGDTGADTGADTGDTGTDTGDTGADTGDTGTDTGDTGADTGDTGADTGDTGADTDPTEPTEPCNPNPCNGIANSTGVCTVSGTSYSCGCNSGYFWNDGKCKRITLGNICTGQTKCYNNSLSITCPTSASADFYGQDAQYTGKCTAQSFSSTSNVVIDNNTGLTWEKSPSSETYTWDNRATHCNELNSSNYGGKSNWRVPNPLELLTIVDNSKYNPATNSNFTEMQESTELWTSKAFTTKHAYYFLPSYGEYFYVEKDYHCKVLCVSGNEIWSATSADFKSQTISGKVVVTDSKTGLMWQKEYAKDKTWQQALKYCEDLTYAGYSDWRLPNKNELASLLDPGKSGIPYSNFPNMPNNDYNYWWSSSTFIGYHAWVVDFGYGHVFNDSKDCSFYVRCVR